MSLYLYPDREMAPTPVVAGNQRLEWRGPAGVPG